MRPFRFTPADKEDKAVKAWHEAGRPSYLGGGTNLLDLMKLHVETPDHLVDVQGLPLDSIDDHGDSVWVGAAVRNSDMAEHKLIRDSFPVVSQALLSGASPQLRNLATLAGNVLQRTRCAYFRDTAIPACNKRRPGSGCAALEGYNRMHAILGASDHCIAANPSDLAVALVALGARVQLLSPEGKRWVELTEFYYQPGDTPHIEHAMDPGELILGVEIPKEKWFRRSAYLKIRDRASYAFALASTAVAIDTGADGTIRAARVAFGGIGTIPWRATDAELSLVGHKLEDDSARVAARLTLAAAQSRRYNAFKVRLAEETLVRALREIGRTA